MITIIIVVSECLMIITVNYLHSVLMLMKIDIAKPTRLKFSAALKRKANNSHISKKCFVTK